MAKLCLLFKIINRKAPIYLQKLISTCIITRETARNAKLIKLPKHMADLLQKNYFLKSFIPSSINEWNKLKPTERTIAKMDTFKKAIQKLLTPSLLYRPYLFGSP